MDDLINLFVEAEDNVLAICLRYLCVDLEVVCFPPVTVTSDKTADRSGAWHLPSLPMY